MNRIIHGDCLEVMKTFPDKSFDLILTDPPYGIGMDGGNVGYKGNNNFEKLSWDSKIPDKAYFDEIFRVSKNQIIFGGNYFGLPATRGFIVWDKGEGFKDRTYAECEYAWTSFDRNARIFKHDPLARGDYRGKFHPTLKPKELIGWIVKNYSQETDSILDPFAGSCTTLIAAEELGRKCICIEKEEKYVKIGQERLASMTKQLF